MHRTREGGVLEAGAGLGVGAAWPVPDSIFSVSDDGDPTKVVKLQLAGLTPATTREITVPDANFTLAGLEIANIYTQDQEIAKPNALLTLNSATMSNQAAVVLELNGTEKARLGWLSSPDTVRLLLASGTFFQVAPQDTRQNSLSVFHSDGTARLQLGVLGGATGYGALWLGSLTPSDSNASILSDGATQVILNAPSGTYQSLQIAGVENARFDKATYPRLFLIGPSPAAGTYALKHINNDAATGIGLIVNSPSGQFTQFSINDSGEWKISATEFAPLTDNADDIGTTSLRPRDIYCVRQFLAASGGSTSAPEYSFQANPDTGLRYFSGDAGMLFSSDNSLVAGFLSGGVSVAGNKFFMFSNSSGDPTATKDIVMGRSATSTLRLDSGGGSGTCNLVLGQGSIGTSGTNTFAQFTGTAPSTSPADLFQTYSADWNGAGTGTFHLRNEEGHTIKLFKGAALTASDGTLANAVTRIGEIEARLQALGLLN